MDLVWDFQTGFVTSKLAAAASVVMGFGALADFSSFALALVLSFRLLLLEVDYLSVASFLLVLVFRLVIIYYRKSD